MSARLNLVINRPHLPSNNGGVIFAGIYIDVPHGTLVERKKHMIFCIDVSGSMNGAPLENAKKAVIGILHKRLREGDMVSLVTFSDDVEVNFNEVFEAKKIEKIESIVRSLRVKSLTAIYGGLEKAGELAKKTPSNYVRKITLLTDGLPNVGPTDPRSFKDLASKLREEGIVIDVIGLGSEYDPNITRTIAEYGGGKHWHVTKPEDLTPVFSKSTLSAEIIVYEQATLRVTTLPDVELLEAVYYLPEARVLNMSKSDNSYFSDLKPIERGVMQRIILQIRAPPRPKGIFRLCKVELLDKKTNNIIGSGDLQVEYTEDPVKIRIESSPDPRIEFFTAKERIKLAKAITEGKTAVDLRTLERLQQEAEKTGSGRVALEIQTIIDGVKNAKDNQTKVDKLTMPLD